MRNGVADPAAQTAWPATARHGLPAPSSHPAPPNGRGWRGHGALGPRSGPRPTARDDTELIGADVEDQSADRNKGFERAQQAIALKLGQVQRVLAAAR